MIGWGFAFFTVGPSMVLFPVRGIVFHFLRACWGFTFDVENEQILVLRKPFLSRIASLRGEKMAK